MWSVNQIKTTVVGNGLSALESAPSPPGVRCACMPSALHDNTAWSGALMRKTPRPSAHSIPCHAVNAGGGAVNHRQLAVAAISSKSPDLRTQTVPSPYSGEGGGAFAGILHA